MFRHILRLSVVALVAPLAVACGGGGHALPPAAQNAQATQNGNGVPSSAMRGVMVAVHLPLRNVKDLDATIAATSDPSSPQFGRFLTPQQFGANYAPLAADVAAAEASLKSAGFETHATAQNVFASAPQAVVEQYLAVHLKPSSGKRSTLSTDRAPRVPEALTKLGATVGVTNFVYQTHSQFINDGTPLLDNPDNPDNRYGINGYYWFTDLKQAYSYPAYGSYNGVGRTIAIVMAGNIQDSDQSLYFRAERFNMFAAVPTVERRPVNGGAPFGGTSDCCSLEASLDAQQSQGSAPGAHVILYNTPNLSQNNILAAYNAIVSENRADIVTSSFGLCELYYTAAYNGGQDYTFFIRAFSDAFKQGNAQGITFVASSGDHGSYECADPSGTTKIQQGVSNPADDPNVTAVGGTNLQTVATPPATSNTPYQRSSPYLSENAYYDNFKPSASGYPNDIWGSGGGISTQFTKPAYQNQVNTGSNQRTIPDISMHMGGCPGGAVTPCNNGGTTNRSFDITIVGGRGYGVIGTSASAPEFAGLLAVTEQALGNVRLGNANNYIYQQARTYGTTIFRHPPGNNGYPTTPGSNYDYVLGVGVPRAAAFAFKRRVTLAGDPWTATNP